MKIPIPREHGTWAMLYAPIVCAAASVGPPDIRFWLFFLSTTAAFFLREPLETWIRLRTRDSQDAQRIAFWRNASMIYCVLASTCAGWLILVYELWILLLFSFLFCLMLGLHVYLVYRKADRTVPAELAAVVALTSSAPACRYVMLGKVDAEAMALWVWNALFFASSVFYVRMRVSAVAVRHRASHAMTWNWLYHVLLMVTLVYLFLNEWITRAILLAFLPVVFRAFVGMRARGKLNLTRIGILEVVFTVLFVAFIIVNFH